MSRAVVASLVVALLAVLVGCGAPPTVGSTVPAPVTPSSADVRMYKVTINGQTGLFNGQTGAYESRETFRRIGTLVIEPGPDGTDFSIGLSSGPFVDRTLGALHVVSNSYVLRHDGYASATDWQAKRPAAQVSASEDGFVATIDPQAAPSVRLNTFVVGGAPTGAPKQILEGTLTITMSGRSVSGTLTLFGGDHVQTASGLYASDIYEATFTT